MPKFGGSAWIRKLMFLLFLRIFLYFFYEVSSYYGMEGVVIGGVGNNPHIHIKPHNEVSLPMTPNAPMLS